MDQKSRNTFPMIDDTGLEALASPMAGYLGKVQERVASLEHCPWCSSKGLCYKLRSYRLNLQDSITLCTNPQCLFPLVSQSLDDVLASLVPFKPVVGCKRKIAFDPEKEDLVEPQCKRLQSNEPHSFDPQTSNGCLISLADRFAMDVVPKGQDAANKTNDEKVAENQWDSPVAQDEGDKRDMDSVSVVCTEGFSSVATESVEASNAPPGDGNEAALSPHGSAPDMRREKSSSEVLNQSCGSDLNGSLFANENVGSAESVAPAPQHNEQTAKMGCKSGAEGIACKDTEGVECEPLTAVMEPKELLAIPNQLFWNNGNNLCWLDSMLVALVKCKRLRKCQPKDETHLSPIWQLMKGYEDICASIETHQQPGGDGVGSVPKHVVQKANADLRSLRMSVFKLLKPRLRCKLGQTETPVFALPLLLAMDPWVEPLFTLIFHWEFKCSQCKTPTKERVMKTLTTFTNVLPDWHPLNAVHLATCNVCCSKNERRTMKLQRVPPVLGLHFVEGLPDNDVSNYTFTFNEKRYSVTICIQYNRQLKHFVTWIRGSAGSWIEYDDMKHPECKTYQKLPVPAEEIHVVFWEVQEDKEPQACSPSSTFGESCQAQIEVNVSPDGEDLITGETFAHAEDHSPLTPYDDTDIVCALSTSADGNDDTDAATLGDTSIGSTTLLDTFEGLTHNDIVTLTLVEIKDGSDMQSVNDNEQTLDSNIPNRNEQITSTAVSSSFIVGSEVSGTPPVETPTTSNSSESDDGSSSDPTFVPYAKERRRKRKPKSRKMAKMEALFDAAPHIPSEASGSNKRVSNTTAGVSVDSAPDGETTQPQSPVSSTNTPPVATTQSLTGTAMPAPKNCWSFLLSRQPRMQAYKAADKITPIPVMEVKPTHSTPNPLRGQQFSVGLPKPQLKTEKGEGLPPKAAEMYDSFGLKSSGTSKPLPSAERNLNVKSKLHTAVVSGTSHPLSGARGLPDVSSSSRSHGNQFSRGPPGLSETEVLRYKLMKKLKAKKKKLAKLNEMLGHQGGASFRQDSIDQSSPTTVTSSTYDGSIGDDLISDLLSPATTASNLSPDSSGFLEVLAGGQEALTQLDLGVNVTSQDNARVDSPDHENFLEDFLSQAVAQRPTEMETEALSALELFI